MQERHKKIGILVGGGPAPGINSVIAAAAIHSLLAGRDVVGIRDGFRWLIEGDTARAKPLSISEVGRIHFQGGSYLGTSRANPTRSGEHLEACLKTLRQLEVGALITIGGDDTAFSALTIEQKAGGGLQVVHVPKTIDNDLDLPDAIPTFGFQTARHLGTEMVKSLMVDARTTSRWYLVVTMGRKAGHLALGIGKAASATLTLIPEEFHGAIRLHQITDILLGSIIKQAAMDHPYGVAVLAEGLVEALDPEDLQGVAMERDAHGHVRLGEINFSEMVKRELGRQLRAMGLDVPLLGHNVGYELRSVDPIPYDLEYARDLGYWAAQSILEQRTGTMVCLRHGAFTPIPFSSMLDPLTGRTRVRLVDTSAGSYDSARRYMVRLSEDDLDNDQAVALYARAAGMTVTAFRERFRAVAGRDPRHTRVGAS